MLQIVYLFWFFGLSVFRHFVFFGRREAENALHYLSLAKEYRKDLFLPLKGSSDKYSGILADMLGYDSNQPIDCTCLPIRLIYRLYTPTCL